MKNTKVSINSIVMMCLLFVCFSCNEAGFSAQEGNEVAAEHVAGEMKNIPLAPSEYVEWIENRQNGMATTKKLNDIVFSLLYKPDAYEALVRLKGDSLTETTLNDVKKELKGMQYYTLRIATLDNKGELLKHKLETTDEYYRRIEYCSFKMQDDIKLIDNGDTLPCRLFHFERVFSVAPEATFVLAFEDTRTGKDVEQGNYAGDKILSFNDGIFELGRINLLIGKAYLNNIPKLDIALNN